MVKRNDRLDRRRAACFETRARVAREWEILVPLHRPALSALSRANYPCVLVPPFVARAPLAPFSLAYTIAVVNNGRDKKTSIFPRPCFETTIAPNHPVQGERRRVNFAVRITASLEQLCNRVPVTSSYRRAREEEINAAFLFFFPSRRLSPVPTTEKNSPRGCIIIKHA